MDRNVLEALPRALWGVQPEAVEQHVEALADRCRDLTTELDGWRDRALRAEAELAQARQVIGRSSGGAEIVAAEREAEAIRARARAEAEAARQRWESELSSAESDLADARAQIDALRKDFLRLLEGVSTAVSQRPSYNYLDSPH